MKRFLYVAALAFLTSGLAGLARADEKEAKAIVDKGIAALGGEEKLTKAGAYSWKSKGTITFNGSDNEFSSAVDPPGARSLSFRIRRQIRRHGCQGHHGLERRQGLAEVQR